MDFHQKLQALEREKDFSLSLQQRKTSLYSAMEYILQWPRFYYLKKQMTVKWQSK
jgi:hypothetical protein